MLKLAIIFTVFLSVLIQSDGVPLRDSDIDKILAALRSRKRESSSELSSSDSEDDWSDEKTLRTMDVIDILQKNSNKRKVKNKILPLIQNRVDDNTLENKKITNLKSQILNLLSQANAEEPLKKEKPPRLIASKLTAPVSFKDDDKSEHLGSLNEYSKIFIVLDPVAVSKSKNKNDLQNLVSKILSLSLTTSEKARQERNKNNRYKGFSVKDGFLSRRYRRDSKENFGGMSGEDEYKQKRPRNEHGGGGAGGRTAIPYIRHRGDIYERGH